MPKRNSTLVSLVRFLGRVFINYYKNYNVLYENTGVLNDFEKKGFIILANHWSNLDPLLEGILLRDVIKREAYYAMCKNIKRRWFLEWVGGVRNKKDIYETLFKDLIEMGEILVIHPEDKRRYKQKFDVEDECCIKCFENLLKMQRQIEKPVDIIPLAIGYEDVYKRGSLIHVCIGEPMKFESNIEEISEHLDREINPILERYLK